MIKHFNVTLSLRADRQLDSLCKYVAMQGGSARAAAFAADILATCHSLSIFPERGSRRDDIDADLRVINHKKSVIIVFRIDQPAAMVVIEGIFYGGQDFEAALREEADD